MNRISDESISVKIDNIDEEQKLALEIFFDTMQFLGNAGGSRWLCFYSDGDGNYKPKIKIDGSDIKIPKEIDLKEFWDNDEMRIDYARFYDSVVKMSDAPETAYKLHFKTSFQGIPISVENRKGTYRRGVDPDGKEWKQKMDFHYGRIPRTRGADGDMVDVFLGPDKSAPMVYVIEQVWPDTGKFDEHKCMLGFRAKADAVRGYKAQYNRPGFYGGCLTMTVEEFKEWIKEKTPAKVERKNLEQRVISGQRVLTDAQKKYRIPSGVSSAANQAIEARKKHGDKVKGGTQVGWTRARQLASGGEVSRDIIMRMRSFFARHEGNQKYEGDFPWGDSGYTAWKLWGGNAGKRWVEGIKIEDRSIKEKISRLRERRAYTDEYGVKHYDMDEEGNPMKDKYLGWDKLVAKLMKENGYSKERAEKVAYSIGVKKYGKAGMAKKAASGRDAIMTRSNLLKTLQEEGKHIGGDYSSLNPKELALGILVELEHADSPMVAMEIAADHLEENPDYYTNPDNPFLQEIASEYSVTDSSSVNTVILEALVTPIIKVLMRKLGFKKLIWKGLGWVIPIAVEEYLKYLNMIPQLKVFDRMLQKFGYEISISPGWFKIESMDRG